MSLPDLMSLPALANQTAMEIAETMLEEFVNQEQKPTAEAVTARLASILQLYEPELLVYYTHLAPILGAEDTRQILDQWCSAVVSLARIRIMRGAFDV